MAVFSAGQVSYQQEAKSTGRTSELAAGWVKMQQCLIKKAGFRSGLFKYFILSIIL
ncbi:MAG: hypothetical protein IPF54_17565 [Draconibacterium sp.]|nr:hypothetical protein [Draconibacterium sp.]